ncbi:MAG: uroporphyrinogen-III C-methyltransferase [Bacillota bacterium]|nr:uroporphyrinogen-III C-methyltransferase [Bacillota bacterium]
MKRDGTAKGKVYLIGAGPGDPGLLTLKGKACLESADAVVYDRLANDRLLAYAKPGAELIYVGKESSRHAMKQEEINALLVKLAREGKVVARLKGGDPFVFGRGGEEAETLRRAGLAFEVVPGVTSAIAAPAYAGIPVTHRGVASSFAVITGHEDPQKAVSAINWEKLATAADTLVFLMGMENLPGIVAQLVAHGRPARTPVALVRWGTTTDQGVLTGTLSDIVERAEAEQFGSPAVIVVGEVVNLRPALSWFEEKPLFGRRVVVTRARAQASKLSERLAELGAEAWEFPAIRVAPPEDERPLRQAAVQVGTYDWVIFTSANGVEAFFAALQAEGGDARSFGGTRVAAIGSETAEALARQGIRADAVPEEFRAEGILAALPADLQGKRILVARAAEARQVLPAELRRRGAEVDEVAAYRTIIGEGQGRVEELRHLLEAGEVDAVTFTSSSTVKNLVSLLGGESEEGRAEVRRLFSGVTVASIGPITTKTARELGLNVQVEAAEYTIAGLVEALAGHFQGRAAV